MQRGLLWFDATHELQGAGMTAQWMAIGLPEAGGIGDQEAWLWQALHYLRRIHNALFAEEMAAKRKQPREPEQGPPRAAD